MGHIIIQILVVFISNSIKYSENQVGDIGIDSSNKQIMDHGISMDMMAHRLIES